MRFLGNNNIFRHGTPGHYSTNFEDNIEGKVEHFDVYGEVCKLNFRRREKLQTFSHFWFYAVQVQTMYSQVYWTRNNPIDLPPELVNSIGRKLFNTFPGKNPCKRNRIWPRIFLERKYFQRWNIFRKQIFSEMKHFQIRIFQVKRFQGKVMAITGYEVDQVLLPSPSPYQANQLINATYPRWPTPVTRKSRLTPKTQTRQVLVGLPAILIAAKATNRWTKLKKNHFQNRQEKLWLCTFLLFAYKSEVNPDCKMKCKIVQVPIYNAYNHHYFSWLQGSDAEMFDLEEPLFLPNPTSTAFRTKY